MVTLYDPWFPYAGKRMNKDGLTATLVCGSNEGAMGTDNGTAGEDHNEGAV